MCLLPHSSSIDTTTHKISEGVRVLEFDASDKVEGMMEDDEAKGC